MMGDGEDDDLARVSPIDEAEGEPANGCPACSEQVRAADTRKLRDLTARALGLSRQVVAEAGDLGVVIVDRFAKLLAGSGQEAQGSGAHERKRFRNSAKTCSAGISSTVPASSWATRRWISSVQACSTSAGSSDGSSSRLTISR